MRPAQLSPQCGDNLLVRENLRELNHAMQRLGGESPAKLLGQLSPQCGDNLHPILRALLLENVLMNPATDVPVKRHQTGINRPGNGFAGREDEIAHLRKQRRGRGAAGARQGRGRGAAGARHGRRVWERACEAWAWRAWLRQSSAVRRLRER
jgi:hypothetical protein